MNNSKRVFYKNIGIIFIGVLLITRLPHDSYSISSYIFRPIKLNNWTLVISGILPLWVFYVGIKGVLTSERNKDRSKLLNFLLIMFLLIPLMKWSLEFTRIQYHWLIRDGIKSIEIMDSNINVKRNKDELTLNIYLEMRDYGSDMNEFKVRIYLPESVRLYSDENFYEFGKSYVTHRSKTNRIIESTIKVKLIDEKKADELSKNYWLWEDIMYELYNEDDSVKNIQRGLATLYHRGID